MRRTLLRRGSFLAGWCGLVLLPLASGCGPGTGKVSGQVTFNGRPLPGGVVTFHPVNTKYNPATGKIDPNGNYEVEVTAGECRISVDNRALKNPEGAAPVGVGGAPARPPGAPPMGGPPPGKVGPPKDAMKQALKDKQVTVSVEKPVGTYVEIPRKFYSPDDSGLSCTVKKGSQTYPIELK